MKYKYINKLVNAANAIAFQSLLLLLFVFLLIIHSFTSTKWCGFCRMKRKKKKKTKKKKRKWRKTYNFFFSFSSNLFSFHIFFVHLLLSFLGIYPDNAGVLASLGRIFLRFWGIFFFLKSLEGEFFIELNFRDLVWRNLNYNHKTLVCEGT